MYGLMLVDDEKEMREGLMEVMPFHELGFTVVGQASNGLEAVQLCEHLSPDLIVTDIRMPLMDGLSMCREIQKLWPTTHFIVLSGYDDFEYARQALAFKSMDYLLKPISSAEFAQVLRTAKQRLDEEYAQKRDMEQLRESYRQSLPLLKEMLLSALLRGGVEMSAVKAEAERYGLRLIAPQYAVAAVRCLSSKEQELENPEIMKLALIGMLKDVLGCVEVFHYNGIVAALIPLPDDLEASFSTAMDSLEEARKTASHYLKAELAIGLGAPCYRLEDLPACARQAISALDQSALEGGGQIMCATDLEPGSRTELAVDESLLRMLANAIKMGDRTGAASALAELMTALVRPTPHNYRAYILEILLTLLRTARDMNADFDVLNDGGITLSCLMRDVEQGNAHTLLQELSDKLLESIRTKREGTSAGLARQADEYLADHYMEQDLSVERLCKALHVSPSYFGALYKQEKKETFHQALTRLRMDRAMTLLTSTDQKTAEIAAAIGIPDPSYFSYAFKRHFGLSPSMARSGKGGQGK